MVHYFSFSLFLPFSFFFFFLMIPPTAVVMTLASMAGSVSGFMEYINMK